MNKKELSELALTFASFGLPSLGSPLWVKAFKLYNEKNEPQLQMGCRPCYGKVLAWHILNLE